MMNLMLRTTIQVISNYAELDMCEYKNDCIYTLFTYKGIQYKLEVDIVKSHIHIWMTICDIHEFIFDKRIQDISELNDIFHNAMWDIIHE